MLFVIVRASRVTTGRRAVLPARLRTKRRLEEELCVTDDTRHPRYTQQQEQHFGEIDLVREDQGKPLLTGGMVVDEE